MYRKEFIALKRELRCKDNATIDFPKFPQIDSKVVVVKDEILYVMLSAISYQLYNLKNAKNIHGGVLLLVKLQANAYIFTKSSTPPWVFFMSFKLYKWYQMEQSIIILFKQFLKVFRYKILHFPDPLLTFCYSKIS